jgi:hypothetical protein
LAARHESRALHHRNLATFLASSAPTTGGNDGRRSTDLVAAHYFPGYRWERPAMRLYNRTSDELDERARRFMNRHLAHLSTDRHHNRHADETIWWDIVQPAAVLDGFERFVADLRADGLDERAGWFAQEVAFTRAVVGGGCGQVGGRGRRTPRAPGGANLGNVMHAKTSVSAAWRRLPTERITAGVEGVGQLVLRQRTFAAHQIGHSAHAEHDDNQGRCGDTPRPCRRRSHDHRWWSHRVEANAHRCVR